jgi:hypothetical protein
MLDEDGSSPLHLACMYRNCEHSVRLLIERDASLLQIANIRGQMFVETLRFMVDRYPASCLVVAYGDEGCFAWSPFEYAEHFGKREANVVGFIVANATSEALCALVECVLLPRGPIPNPGNCKESSSLQSCLISRAPLIREKQVVGATDLLSSISPR